MDYLNAFWVGGLICALVQILLDRTKLMPGRVMVMLVCSGAVLGFLGIYEPSGISPEPGREYRFWASETRSIRASEKPWMRMVSWGFSWEASRPAPWEFPPR